MGRGILKGNFEIHIEGVSFLDAWIFQIENYLLVSSAILNLYAICGFKHALVRQ